MARPRFPAVVLVLVLVVAFGASLVPSADFAAAESVCDNVTCPSGDDSEAGGIDVCLRDDGCGGVRVMGGATLLVAIFLAVAVVSASGPGRRFAVTPHRGSGREIVTGLFRPPRLLLSVG